MTKADIINEIISKTNLEKPVVTATVEALMETIKTSMTEGETIYLRGFGTFLLKKRAQKIARNITTNSSVVVLAHIIPAFKPSRKFLIAVRSKFRVK